MFCHPVVYQEIGIADLYDKYLSYNSFNITCLSGRETFSVIPDRPLIKRQKAGFSQVTMGRISSTIYSKTRLVNQNKIKQLLST